MAFDAFIKIDGIDGESTDAKHKGEIEILSYSWGLANPSSFGAGGAGSGRAQWQEFHFVSRLQRASPKLFQNCASGAHIKTALLSIRKSGSGNPDYLKLTLGDVMVTSFEELGTEDGQDTMPDEKLGLTFARIQVEYLPTDSKGATGASVKAGWDVGGNKPL